MYKSDLIYGHFKDVKPLCIYQSYANEWNILIST